MGRHRPTCVRRWRGGQVEHENGRAELIAKDTYGRPHIPCPASASNAITRSGDASGDTNATEVTDHRRQSNGDRAERRSGVERVTITGNCHGQFGERRATRRKSLGQSHGLLNELAGAQRITTRKPPKNSRRAQFGHPPVKGRLSRSHSLRVLEHLSPPRFDRVSRLPAVRHGAYKNRCRLREAVANHGAAKKGI
jgi:hypothetical protein